MIARRRQCAVGITIVSALLLAVAARAQNPQLDRLKDITIDQKLNAQVPLGLEFKNANGQTVKLADYFGDVPVIINLAYYECPMLCTLVMNGMVKALNAMKLEIDKDYVVVTLSIDPGETPALARAKKETYVHEYRRKGADQGWAFLTGEEDAIRELTDAVGFRYRYDPELDQYAHASGIIVATPEGRLSKYFYGVEFSARDLRLGLVDAGNRRIGSTVDQVLLWCYHYDPTTGKYGVAIMNMLRVGGALTVGGIAALMIGMLRRDRRVARETRE